MTTVSCEIGHCLIHQVWNIKFHRVTLLPASGRIGCGIYQHLSSFNYASLIPQILQLSSIFL